MRVIASKKCLKHTVRKVIAYNLSLDLMLGGAGSSVSGMAGALKPELELYTGLYFCSLLSALVYCLP